MSVLSERPTYTREQLAKYVDLIHGHADATYTLERLEAEIKADPLGALAGLQRKQLAAVPWGNVALHYSTHRCLSLEADALYHKIVERRLGGYCMENNSFFSTVLRSLGYDLYITGARVSNTVEMNGQDPDGFQGWEHMVIFVTINGQKYHVDVGFASQGACQPIPLREGETVQCVPGLEGRLVYRPIAQNTVKSQKMWVFETRDATRKVWMAAYCFTELEFLPQDFVNFNYRTSQDPLSWFTYRLVLTRVVLDEKLENAVGTVVMIGPDVMKRIGSGASETVASCATEADRVDALDKWFGIKLRPYEAKSIVGMISEIRPPMTGV